MMLTCITCGDWAIQYVHIRSQVLLILLIITRLCDSSNRRWQSNDRSETTLCSDRWRASRRGQSSKPKINVMSVTQIITMSFSRWAVPPQMIKDDNSITYYCLLMYVVNCTIHVYAVVYFRTLCLSCNCNKSEKPVLSPLTNHRLGYWLFHCFFMSHCDMSKCLSWKAQSWPPKYCHIFKRL